MPVTAEFNPDELKHYLRVSAAGMESDAELLEILKDVQAAAAQVLELKPEKGTHAYQICIEVDGYAPEPGAYNPYEIKKAQADRNDPWCGFCPAFWTKVIARPDLQETVDEVLLAYCSTLAKLRETSISAPSESDEQQFGEPLLAHLAISDPRFWEIYRNFLGLWDLGHEVEITGAIDAILHAHGWRPETEKLLEYSLIDLEALDGDATHMLLRTWKKLHPKRAQSRLFRRFIVTQYRWHLMGSAETLRAYNSGLKHTDGDLDAKQSRSIRYTMTFDAGTGEGRREKEIVSELQALHQGRDAKPKTTWMSRLRGLLGR